MEYRIKKQPTIHYIIMNKDYMPLKARLHTKDYLLTRKDTTKLISGQAIIESEDKEALHMDIEIKNVTKGTKLELPYLFYPGYTIELTFENEKILLDATESDYGFLKIVIPKDIEKGKITIDYTATTLEKISYIISLISIIVFVIYVINYRKNKFEIKLKKKLINRKRKNQ